MSEPSEFDLLAASLRADMADLPAWVGALSVKLTAALPGQVIAHRSGLFGNGPVDMISVDLDSWRYQLRLDHGHMHGERAHLVRGIVLKSEPLSLDAWIDALSLALAERAATSARERAAIRRLLT